MTPEHVVLRERLAGWRSTTLRGRNLNVFMDQNNKCNLRCKMCGFADPRVESLSAYDMSRSVFDSIAAQLFPTANYLQLSMFTEPFMTADFPDRLTLVREHAVPFSHIITNGTLLTERSIQKVLDAQISLVTISIDGGTKQGYEEIRVGARFESVVRNIRLLQAMRREQGALPRIRFNHVISRWNIDRFDEFLEFVDDMRPDELDVRAVERMTFTTGNEWTDPAFVEKALALRSRLISFCKRLQIHDGGFLRDQGGPIDLFTDSGGKITCRRPWDTVAIHANGDVQPCMAWTRTPIGNLGRQTFTEIWTGSEAEALRREFEVMRPGIDCVYCTIKKDVYAPYDDFFFKMLSKRLDLA